MRHGAASFALVLLLGAAVVAQTQATDPSKPEVVPIDQEPSHHLVFENEYVRVFSVEVAPHSETKYHQHDRDYVFVTLGDSDVEGVRVGGASVKLQPKDGEAQFTKGGFAHKAVNNSDKPFRNVTVEMKVAIPMEDVICGAGKGICGASAGARTDSTTTFSQQYVVRAKGLDVETRQASGRMLMDWCGKNSLVIYTARSAVGTLGDEGGVLLDAGKFYWTSLPESSGCKRWLHSGRFTELTFSSNRKVLRAREKALRMTGRHHFQKVRFAPR